MSDESDSSNVEPSSSSSSEAISSAALPLSSRKKAVRFNLQYDTALLQEVFSAKPWAAVHDRTREMWDSIASEISAVVSKDKSGSEAVQVEHGACKRRYDALMKAFKKEELQSMRASGTVEKFDNRKKLLTDLSSLVSEYEDDKAAKFTKERAVADRREAVAEETMQAATSGLKRKPSELNLTHISARLTKSRVSRLDDYLESKEARAAAAAVLKNKVLEIARQRLDIERARLDREESLAHIAVMQANTSLLLRLMDKLDK